MLPDHPDKTMTKETNEKWSASGLKIELLEPRQRWRITYNGLLWNQCPGDTSNEDNVEHIRLNFIFIGKPRSLEWPDDWSTHLHADALAREPWKSPDWMHKIKLIDYTGFDQWGSIIGQITFKDSSINELYLRGLCQRRWGKHESHQFHQIITFFGVTKHGAMYYLGVNDTKYSFSHMQFGHLEEAGGKISKIDWTDLKLSDFEKENAVRTTYKIAFTAAGKNYDAINYTVGDAITYYNGPSWACTTRNLHVQLNGSEVPQGFCVTSFALEQQLHHHKQLQELINDIVNISRGKKKEDLKTYCEKTVSSIRTTPVEKQIERAILEGLEGLERSVNGKNVCNLYAVRSSAVGEDGEETSAAGQNSTYLGVKNANDIINCVAKCWASLFSYQSVEYRRQNGLPIKVSMGVCIQRMIDAEAAGVMFTRHPTTGDPSSITIAANYGLGESALQDVDKEITIANKMVDVAICGRVVMTSEIHQLAVQKYGIVSGWRKMYLMYDMFKTMWMSDAIVRAATDMSNKFILNANEFDTPRNLYNDINKKYKEIYLIAQCHNIASMINVSYQMIAMLLLTKGSDNFTSNHLADIAVLLSSCTNVISTEVPIALSKIAACIRKNCKSEEFSKIEPAEAIDWLKLNCPPAAEKLCAFFDMHGHRCVQELDLFAEPWIFRSDSIISTIQTQAMSPEKNYVSKMLNVQETIASLKTPMSSFTKWLLQLVIPLCRKAVTRREMTKDRIVSAVHTLRLAYKHLGVLMVAENCIPDENLIFFLTHQEIGQLLNNHNSLLVRKALRRKKIYQQAVKLEYPEFSVGMPIPVQKTLDASFYEGCTKIEGTSICGGSWVARACVITDLSEAKNIQHGDILITHCTDIGWSPYFPLLGGIVTELGGLISHGAVVAREYGLPCIVGAKSATQVFQTGDTVLLAGDVGVLQLIKKVSNNEK
ncbi:Probable phosphoenolpyruvate synthase [Camponotus floridanus]|uniref:Probable phosphoenolpyruvate synthase n=1 Tax=Camponotus floridanus TaxID=104421 RepID=E2AW36_CAMFO|nr:Probable phosphoenolpyruvate synthase [Camponotus floridanus]